MDVHVVTLLADALSAVARGETSVAAGYVERALKALKGQQTLPGIAPAPAPDAKAADRHREAAVRIFGYWQRVCGKTGSVRFTPDRVRVVVARLREGYSEAEIRKAVDGAAQGAYVNPESGLKYDDLELICRNGTKLESFIARGEAATGALVVEMHPSAGAAAIGLEDEIANLRRRMATMRAQGRDTEYGQAEVELAELMKRRNR